ncbi:hypothetical protein Fleli_2170 [Bernardetia litoralis DSM 6794]|uniref:Uncharacterized protein n=1 Tax=Bernardetia litoralis (strain ATCC 23117 / DSM 6794 / NBRC 15988 / NCIMB 1366 / Fx l1 / Sio-4) TaxID=880071 RepID=I4AKR5_BERLS|nr:hypothetical protein [Bernardetia litoralis]AFM04550.1 hypothetical protein Fleli_2170 [Bernardetia litoralis DSM 6794]
MKTLINKNFYFIVILFTCFLSSCTPTTENELKKWEVNKNTINELKVGYPTFSSLLESDFEKMQAKWEESQKITDEEKKAEEMNQINNLFYSGYIQDLFSVNSRLEEIEEQKQKINGLKMTDSKRERADEEIEEANEKVGMVKQLLSQKINDQAAATEIAEEAKSELIAIIAALNTVIKTSKKKKKK